jgi:hypothetical protein
VLLAGLLDLAPLGSASTLSLAAQDATGSHALTSLAIWLFPVPFAVWLAPKVSYRRRDVMLGPWMIGIIAWRIAYLPYHDWPPRDDEAPRAQYIREAEFGGEWKSEYAGLWRLPKPGDVQVVSSSAV